MSGQLKLSDWKIFEVLAEKGSFRKASEVLVLDSANIKRSLDKLESALKLKLFARSPRGLRLTEDGIAYQFKIKELMAPLEVELAEPKRRVVSVQYDARLSFSRLLLLLSRYKQIDSGLVFNCSGDDANAEDFLSIRLQPGKGLQGFTFCCHQSQAFERKVKAHYLQAAIRFSLCCFVTRFGFRTIEQTKADFNRQRSR